MSDEERLVAAVGLGWMKWRVTSGLTGLITAMRDEGVTLTPPPAPEPTFTITFTQKEIRWLEHFIGCLPARSIIDAATAEGIYNKIDDATPDPEPAR